MSSAVQEPGACCNAGSRIDRLASGVAELRELSLAINTPEGMAIVVGFSHPGIDNIVAAATPVMRTSRKSSPPCTTRLKWSTLHRATARASLHLRR